MIFMLIRLGLLALKRAGFNVPTIPTLRSRPSLIEQLLTPPDQTGRPDSRSPSRRSALR